MEFDVAAAEILKSVRGRRSQGQINLKLGLAYNQMSKWECKQRPIPWPEFARVCAICKVDLKGAISRVFGLDIETGDSRAFVTHLLANQKLVDASRTAGVSRYKLGRWQNGNTTPGVDDILRLIHTFSATYLLFLENLVDLDTIPSIQTLRRSVNNLRKIVFEHPHALAVWCAMTLESIQKKNLHPKVISDHVGIESSEVEAILDAFERTGQIEKIGKKIVPKKLRIDIRDDFEGKNFLRKFWLNEAKSMLHSIKETTERSKFGFLTYGVSEIARQKIIDAYYRFYQEIMAVMDTDTGEKVTVQVLNLQILDFIERANLPR